jgi:Tyrosine phosphatase family
MRTPPPAALARAVGLGFALWLGGCAATVPTPPPPRPLDDFALARFQLVDGGVYRSSQPSRTQLDALATGYALRTVIKLNRGSDDAPPGVHVIPVPLDPMREPDALVLARILDEIDRAPKPLLIHCTHGEDRTGLIVALWRMRHGASAEAAYADMVRHGFHPYPGLWSAWLHASGWNRPIVSPPRPR